MRKRLFILAMLFTCGIELAWAPPVRADDAFSYDAFHSKKQRRKRNLVTLGVVGCVVTGLFIFIILNAVDRGAARRRLEEKQLERQQNGLV